MKSVVIAVLVFLTAGLAHAQQIPCETFDRSNTDAPRFVRDYLDGDSKGLFVWECGFADFREYFEASDLVRDGNICRYSTYTLNLMPESPSRLERKDAPPVTYMLVSTSNECPSPQAIDYVWTYHVQPDVFERLVHVWHSAIASPASFDRAAFWAFSADKWRRQARSQLRDVILQGRSDRLAVMSVQVRAGIGLWKRYELHVADPDHHDRFYAVAVRNWFGRIYRISDFRQGIY